MTARRLGARARAASSAERGRRGETRWDRGQQFRSSGAASCGETSGRRRREDSSFAGAPGGSALFPPGAGRAPFRASFISCFREQKGGSGCPPWTWCFLGAFHSKWSVFQSGIFRGVRICSPATPRHRPRGNTVSTAAAAPGRGTQRQEASGARASRFSLCKFEAAVGVKCLLRRARRLTLLLRERRSPDGDAVCSSRVPWVRASSAWRPAPPRGQHGSRGFPCVPALGRTCVRAYTHTRAHTHNTHAHTRARTHAHAQSQILISFSILRFEGKRG